MADSEHNLKLKTHSRQGREAMATVGDQQAALRGSLAGRMTEGYQGYSATQAEDASKPSGRQLDKVSESMAAETVGCDT